MSEGNPTISEVFKSIEKQAGLRFSYDNTLDLSRRVTLPTTPTSVSTIMDKVLEGTRRSYVIAGKSILVKLPTEKEPEVKTVAPAARINISTQRVEGVVTESGTQRPLYRAEVLIKGSETYQGMTDNNGRFVVDNVVTGTYNLTVSHPDHITYQTQVVITKKRAEQMLVSLQIKDGKIEEPYPLESQVSTAVVPIASLLKGIEPGKRQVAPRFGVKTNLLADLTTTINLGFEFRLTDRVTLDIPVSLNPWTFSDNAKIKRFLVQPELRFWQNEPYNGHFWGVNLLYSVYNVGGFHVPLGLWKELKESRYEGHLFGGGVSYGYQWILSNRFNLEANFGIGYFYTNYKKSECAGCGPLIEEGTKHYFGPTKVGISLIYIIK